MKVIPKFDNGGYVIYQPMVQPLKIEPPTNDKSQLQANSSKSNTLEQKDLLDLLKTVDGLPNDMDAIAKNAINLLNSSSLNTSDLSTNYISNILSIKTAAFSKKEYDKSFNLVSKNGGLNEIAITESGKMLVQDIQGNTKQISIREYFKNHQRYNPLTNSNLLYLRAHDPRYTGANGILNIVNNGVGMDTVDKQIRSRMGHLGTNTQSIEGYMVKQGPQVQKGMSLLQQMSAQEFANTGMTLDGLYKTKQITKEQMTAINAALTYIYKSLPTNSQTLLQYKSRNINDPEKGAVQLIYSMLMSQATNSNDYTVNFEGTLEQVLAAKGKNSSKGDDDDSNTDGNIKTGPYYNMSRMIGGSDFDLSINKGTNSEMRIKGKNYSSIPDSSGKPVEQTSIRDLLSRGFAGVVSDMNGITFGDKLVPSTNLEDIMYDGNGGTMAVLPAKIVNGHKVVDLDILDEWEKATSELRSKGIKSVLDKNHQDEIVKVLFDHGLQDYVNLTSGEVNLDALGQFMILDGYYVDNNDKPLLETSTFVTHLSDPDDAVIETIERALSTDNDKSNYKIDAKSIMFGHDNEIYQGSIYIPITNNQLQALTADGQHIKEPAAIDKELDYQIWVKGKNMKSTKSESIQ